MYLKCAQTILCHVKTSFYNRILYLFSLCLSDFLWQFYNSLCRNLPRRYVLPLTVDEQTPLNQNLVTLNNYKATAKLTKPEEVGLNWGRRRVIVVMKELYLTVHHTLFDFTGIRYRYEVYNHDKFSQFTPTQSAQLSSMIRHWRPFLQHSNLLAEDKNYVKLRVCHAAECYLTAYVWPLHTHTVQDFLMADYSWDTERKGDALVVTNYLSDIVLVLNESGVTPKQ